MFPWSRNHTAFNICTLTDKTQVFHDQIEVKQKELQPWTGQINAKQADVDVASSERDALVKKAEAVRQAGKDAQEALKKLQADQELKVSCTGSTLQHLLTWISYSFPHWVD